MKKIFAAILSLALCGTMLTACNTKGPASEGVTESLTAAETAGAVKENETEKQTEAETAAETEKETEKETEAAPDAAGNSYKDLDEFSKTSGILDMPTDKVAAKDSHIYPYMKSLGLQSGSVYIDGSTPDGKGTFTIAMSMEKKKVYLKAAGLDIGQGSEDITDMTVIIKDNTMYMLSDKEKSGFYMNAGEEDIFGEVDVDTLFGDIDFDKEMDEADDVKTAQVNIGGKDYTFEIAETGDGFLFDGDKLYAMILTKNEYNFNAMVINKFSSDVPDSLFEIPSDYEIMDLMAAFGE